jgi:tetratricopeptide (TPR) repeat protein
VATWREILATLYEHRGSVYEQAGQLSEAVDAWQEFARLQEVLMSDYPNSADRFGYRLPRCHLWMGEVLWRLGRREEAEAEFRQFRELSERLNLGDPYAIELRAWFLSNCADPQFRDPMQAVELAKPIAAQSMWASTVMTLGAAQYRAGEYRDAIATLDRATQMSDQAGAESVRLFLAMAHWQLGNAPDTGSEHQPTREEQARHRASAWEWYQEAVDLQGKIGGWTEFVRLRHETEELMRIQAGTSHEADRLNSQTSGTSQSATETETSTTERDDFEFNDEQ